MKKKILPVVVFVLISAFARAQSGDKIAVSVGGSAMLASESAIGVPDFRPVPNYHLPPN
jgi:hypothetical protein